MNFQYQKQFETSIPHDTQFLQFHQTFQKSIGYSQQVKLHNASELREEEYLRDMLIYNTVNQVLGCSTIPEEIQNISNGSNQFLQINQNNKPKFIPSKWQKPIKINNSQKKNQQLKEITFGKPASKFQKTAAFPDLKILQNHSKQIEEVIANASSTTSESLSQQFEQSRRKQQQWNKAKNAIMDLKKLIN